MEADLGLLFAFFWMNSKLCGCI